MLAYEFFHTLHGNDTRSAIPYKNQELTAVQVGIALRPANGATCPKVEDHGTDEMLYFIHVVTKLCF